MTKCPKCGGEAGYSVRVRAFGYSVHEGTWNGMEEHIADQSHLSFVADKTVRCLECGKRTLMKLVRAA
jgi:hypothetical protein